MFAGQLLFIIFGWPKKQKTRENVLIGHCRHCRNVSAWTLVRQRRWLSLFFIPVMPLGRASFSVHCNVCMTGVEIERSRVDAVREFQDITRRARGGGITPEEYERELRALVNAVPELAQRRVGLADTYSERNQKVSRRQMSRVATLKNDLTTLSGVDEEGAKRLREAGYQSVEAIALAEVNQLMRVEGLNEKLAERIRTLARDEVDNLQAASRRLQASKAHQ